MILAVVAIILYFVVGMIFMKFKMKAEGLNIIPNINLWKSIPFLFFDGIKFMFEGFAFLWDKLLQITKQGKYKVSA
jgi:hypothetical protein